jgi:guanidinopropionase
MNESTPFFAERRIDRGAKSSHSSYLIIALISLNVLLLLISSYFIYTTRVVISNYQTSLNEMKHEFLSYQNNVTDGFQQIELLLIKYEKEQKLSSSSLMSTPLSKDIASLKQSLSRSKLLSNFTQVSQMGPETFETSFFLPPTGSEVPRFAGVATFMRLPLIHGATNADMFSSVQIGFKGIPWDGGTTNRAGARHGPRAIRDASTLIRDVNRATGIDPFQLQHCADLGDVFVNPVDLTQTLQSIETEFLSMIEQKISPLAVGGDHLSTLPILRALSTRYPHGMALIHFDAHCDTWDSYFTPTHRYTHGTTFRRAIEEGLILANHTVQIGLRGALYRDARDSWSHEHGITEIDLDEFHSVGMARVVERIREIVSQSTSIPIYVTFDIDVLDPAYAPGTGTPEVGGMTVREAQLLIRSLSGLNVIGGDVMEISPPFDTNGQITSLAGATILYELLCVLSESRRLYGGD